MTLGWAPILLFVQPLFPVSSLPHLPTGYGFPRAMDSNHHVSSAGIRITWEGVFLINMSFLRFYLSFLPLPHTSWVFPNEPYILLQLQGPQPQSPEF